MPCFAHAGIVSDGVHFWFDSSMRSDLLGEFVRHSNKLITPIKPTETQSHDCREH